MTLYGDDGVHGFAVVNEYRRANAVITAKGVDYVQSGIHLACGVRAAIRHAITQWDARFNRVAIQCVIEQPECYELELCVDALFAFVNLGAGELFNRVFIAFNVGDGLRQLFATCFKVGDFIIATLDCATLCKTCGQFVALPVQVSLGGLQCACINARVVG